MKPALPLLALALLACPPSGPTSAPTIVSFTSPTVCLPGAVTLSWTVADANSVSIDNGVGDVSSTTSATVNLTATTTFTLTATNAIGTTKKALTVALGGFTSLPLPAGLRTAHLAVADDRQGLAFIDTQSGASATVCRNGACTKEFLFSGSLYYGDFLLAALNGNYFGVGSVMEGPLPSRMHLFTETANRFNAGQEVDANLDTSGVASIAADVPTGRISLMANDALARYLRFAERAQGSWSVAAMYVGGTPVTNAVVFGNGYAYDGTAFAVFAYNGDTMVLMRRSGTAWSIATQQQVNGGVAIQATGGPSLAVSPDGRQAIALWGTYLGLGKDEASAVSIDLTTNTISTTSTLLSPFTIGVTNFYTSADFGADSKKAHYAIGTYDGRAWTGQFSAGTFSAPTPFHAEEIVDLAPQALHDACDNALIAYGAHATSAAPITVHIEPMP